MTLSSRSVSTRRERSAGPLRLSSLRRWQRAGLEKAFHPLEPLSERRGPLRLVRFARGVVGQHRVVEDEFIDDLRGARRDRPRFNGAVIQVIRLPVLYRLSIGVGELSPSHEHLTAAKRAHSAQFTVLA